MSARAESVSNGTPPSLTLPARTEGAWPEIQVSGQAPISAKDKRGQPALAYPSGSESEVRGVQPRRGSTPQRRPTTGRIITHAP